MMFSSFNGIYERKWLISAVIKNTNFDLLIKKYNTLYCILKVNMWITIVKLKANITEWKCNAMWKDRWKNVRKNYTENYTQNSNKDNKL